MAQWGTGTGKSTGLKIGVGATVTALAVTGAVLYPGHETADVDLNDGGVWVVNKSVNKVGHLNYQSRVLDGGVLTPLPSYDLAQEGERVFVRNLEQASLNTIDPAAVRFTEESALPANSSFSFGTDVVAVTDAEHGAVYGTPVERLGSFAAQDTEPLLDAEGGVLAAVGPDDTVWAVDVAAGVFHSYTALPDGGFEPAGEVPVEGLAGAAEPQLSVVGDTAVVFDEATGAVYTSDGGHSSVVDPAGGMLQAPGPEADAAVVALGNKLASVPLGGGEPAYRPLEATGEPVRPVRVAGCTYAAWGGTGAYLRDCDDDAADQAATIPQLGGGAELVFRTNRDVVVLNDVASGNVWLVNEGMQVVNNWSDLEPPKGKGEQKKEDSKEITDAVELPNRGKENKDPVAKDDTFGVRAGRTTPLPVLFNDVDPDGDLLLAGLEGKQPAIGTLQRIYDGTGFQLVVPEDASGTATFTYTASDGRGGEDTATATVRVVPESENNAPRQERTTTLRVEQGGSVSRNVLTDWQDPDGDDLQLLGGSTQDRDTIRVTPDGTLTYQDSGKTVGPKDITVQVSDGRSGTQGRVVVDVLAKSAVPPVPSTDHVVATVGENVTFSPLENDDDPSGRGLRLASVDDVDGVRLEANRDSGAVTLQGSRPGTFYAKYVATNGPASAAGLVRIDIEEPEANPGNPVAVRDTALLPAGGNVLVNVLGNDSDPAGGVLVLTGVESPDGAPFSLSVERNSFVRVTDVRGLTEPMNVEYTVSNGSGESTGQITVIPVPAPPRLEPPRPNPDEVVVRAGDVATVDVLQNDTHPNGEELTLLPRLKEAGDLGEGALASVSGESVRFRAGDTDTPREVSAVYTVAGPDGQEADARVTFRIVPRNAEQNSPPTPQRVVGRVLAGGTTNIVVPLNGIDPDGDSVSLVQLGSAPAKGTARIVGGAIEYTAAKSSSGTDAFSYVVEDRFGARATGSAMVGIAPLDDENNAPVAVNDSITVRPDRPVAVDVLANDSDPDGDPVALVDDLGTSNAVEARVDDGRIVLTSPPEKGSVSVRYTAADGRGGTARATLTVESDPEAKLLAPIARDDRATAQEAMGREEVLVPILENDEDPDGNADDLEVALPDSPEGVRVQEDGLAVAVQAQPRVVAYTVTDRDGLASTAFVHVPGSGGARPVLASDRVHEVTAGETLDLDLRELVRVRDGRTPRLTTEEKVASVPESRIPLVASATALEFQAPEDYSGPASLTFEVTDGTGPDDPDGLTSLLSVPIRVLPRPEENKPPTLQSNELRVAQGEDAARLDLRQSASDPDPNDELSFELVRSSIDGVDVALDGSALTAQAPANTPKGTTGTATVAVTDGHNPPVEATVAITVMGSTRELPVAVDDVVEDAHQGRTEVVDVLANDHNPYEGEGPLEIIGATGQQGQGSAEVRGNRLAITPAGDFVGTMNVRYTIGDVTEDADRQVEGTVTLNVKGRPEAPGIPLVESTGDRTVVLRWDAPADNGAAIEHYTVRAGGFEQQCAATTCTLGGLTNDTVYNFTVTATNAVGESEPSAESADARPDVRPEQPAPPAGVSGDQEAKVDWTTPASRGSAVTGYTLEISPTPPNGVSQVTGLTGTSHTWTGLANGTSYQFRVQAHNKADEPSDWSGYSGSVVPAGRPFTPAAPTAHRVESAVDGGVVDVDWNAPDNNGATITSYTLHVYQDGAKLRDIAGIGDTQQRVTGLETTRRYSFSVTAHNKVGASDPSAQSTAVTPYGRPLTPGQPTATATGNNGDVRLRFGAANANGSPVTTYQYRTESGSWQDFGNRTSGIIQSPNGVSHSWQVRAVNAAGAGPASSGSNSTSAYGPPVDGGGRRGIDGAQGERSVTFDWNRRAAAYNNGRGTDLSVSVDAGRLDRSTGRVTGLAYDQRVTLTVTARANLNQGDESPRSRSWTVSARAGSAPPPPTPPKATLRRGSPVYDPGSCTISCYKFNIEAQNMQPNTTYEVKCMNQNGRFDHYNQFIRTNGSGNAPAQDVDCWVGKNNANPFYAFVGSVRTNDVQNW